MLLPFPILPDINKTVKTVPPLSLIFFYHMYPCSLLKGNLVLFFKRNCKHIYIFIYTFWNTGKSDIFCLFYAAFSFENLQMHRICKHCWQFVFYKFLCKCRLAAPVPPLDHQPLEMEPFSGECNCSSDDHKINDTHWQEH